MKRPARHNLVFPATQLNNRLPAIFSPGRVTNSYKFFWFLALLEFVQRGERFEVSIEELVDEMVIQVWYPVNLFRLNLGKSDQLARAVEMIQAEFPTKASARPEELRPLIRKARQNPEIQQKLLQFERYVPFRLLSPWFPGELKGIDDTAKRKKIIQLANAASRNIDAAPIYSFRGDQAERIHINHHWFWYLRDHYAIIQQFALHQLLDFLQRRNPHTPHLREKLFPPEKRATPPSRPLWKGFLERHPGTACIYSQTPLDNFALDHFLPWTFVAHDQAWNLAPISPQVNSQKGNRLPTQAHLPAFAALQQRFIRDVQRHHPKSSVLEDYASFFRADPQNLGQLPATEFQTRMSELILPQLVVARNMGFLPW